MYTVLLKVLEYIVYSSYRKLKWNLNKLMLFYFLIQS